MRAGKGGNRAHLDGVYQPADGLGRRGTLPSAAHPLVTVLCMVMVLVAACCRVVVFPRGRLPRSVGLLAAGAWGVQVKTTEPAKRVCSTRRRRVHTATGASPLLLLPRKFTMVAFALDRDRARPPTMANGAVWGDQRPICVSFVLVSWLRLRRCRGRLCAVRVRPVNRNLVRTRITPRLLRVPHCAVPADLRHWTPNSNVTGDKI